MAGCQVAVEFLDPDGHHLVPDIQPGGAAAEQGQHGRDRDQIAGQQQLVGQVLDAKGQPLSGVEVRNLKNATVTVTDQEGRFKLTGSVSDQIQFRLIGFNTKVVSGKDVQALVLDASENALDEVVVVGYGKQKKGNLTGAVEVVRVILGTIFGKFCIGK